MALILVFVFLPKLTGKGTGSTTTTSAVKNNKNETTSEKQKATSMPGLNIESEHQQTIPVLQITKPGYLLCVPNSA